MPSWKKIIQSGSDAHLSKITASELRISSIKFDDGGTIASSTGGGGFKTTGSISATTADLEVTGTLKVNTQNTSDTAIFTNNVQNGYPTSNNWGENLEGSFFNNFNNTTHVSEILRFMAGLLSSSLDVADAQPNEKTYFSVGLFGNNFTTIENDFGFVPNNFSSIDNEAFNYLDLKGFVDTGEKLFDGISNFRDVSSAFVDFNSTAFGTTDVSSDNSPSTTQLFGLGRLSSGNANPFNVKVVATHSFSDNSSNNSPTVNTNTFTTQSEEIFIQSSFGTSNGLTLGKIETAQPAVIPAAFQDAKFDGVGGTGMSGTLTAKFSSTSTDFTDISSSGYYRWHGLKVGVGSGSGETTSPFIEKNSSNTLTRFHFPKSRINTLLGSNTIEDSGNTLTKLTATSRSLSGAPYINSATWKVESEISGLFNPMYTANTKIVSSVTHVFAPRSS